MYSFILYNCGSTWSCTLEGVLKLFWCSHRPSGVLNDYSDNLEEIKNAIKNKDGEKLMKIFLSTKKVRKEIIEAGQDTDKPGFGRK